MLIVSLVAISFFIHCVSAVRHAVEDVFSYQNVLPIDTPQLAPKGSVRTRATTVYRPRSLEALHHARHRSMNYAESEKVEWVENVVDGPDVEDRHTLAQLARMSGNAYALPGQGNWYEVDPAWSIVRVACVLWDFSLISFVQSFPVGWDREDDGFRGHVFLSSDNSTIVLSIKGTTLQGPTSKKDKFNDNLYVTLNKLSADSDLCSDSFLIVSRDIIAATISV
jgi:lipase ATG15